MKPTDSIPCVGDHKAALAIISGMIEEADHGDNVTCSDKRYLINTIHEHNLSILTITSIKLAMLEGVEHA